MSVSAQCERSRENGPSSNAAESLVHRENRVLAALEPVPASRSRFHWEYSSRVKSMRHFLSWLIFGFLWLGTQPRILDAQVAEQPLRERPQVHRLPLDHDSLDASSDLAAVVLHAGGAVRFCMPGHWLVDEVPVGRQMRLMLGTSDAGGNDIDSMWLALRYRPTGFQLHDDPSFLRFATNRLGELSRKKATNVIATMRNISGKRWAHVEFRLASRDSRTRLQTGFGSELDALDTEGRYLLHQVDWGWLEVYVTRVKSRDVEQSWALVERILETVQLTRPTASAARPNPAVESASPILGSWKSSRSRMRLDADGVVFIVTDRPFEVEDADATDENAESAFDTRDAGNPEVNYGRTPSMATTLRGSYRAEGDVLFTTWSDGSQLNYRWRLHKGDLLLTDNEGRTAKLWRILE